MKDLHAIAERITRLHCGRTVRDIMADAEAGAERAMLHWVLDAMNRCGPGGYVAVAGMHGRNSTACDKDWAAGMVRYRNDQHWRSAFHHIVEKLTIDGERA